MTMYASTQVRISASVVDFDGNPMSPTDFLTVTITVYDIDGSTVLVDTADMDWNSVSMLYQYFWDTPPVAGAYSAIVNVTSGSFTSLGKKYIRLRQMSTANGG